MGGGPDNIVISPGPGRPENPTDFGMCAQVLREAKMIPILGVCLGHEGLGLVHGAKVVHAAEPMHGRLSSILHNGDALFSGVPQGFQAVRYHSLVVEEGSLRGLGKLEATAWTDDGVLMAMRHKTHPHWGVQFHPESIGTDYGSSIIENFRDLTLSWKSRNSGHTKIPSWFRGGKENSSDDGGLGNDLGIVAPMLKHRVRTSPLQRMQSLEKAAEKIHENVPRYDGTLPVPSGHGDGLTEKSPFRLVVKEVALSKTCSKEVGENIQHTLPCMLDVEMVFRALYGDKSTSWWLDSSNRCPGLALDGQAKARFSFMGGVDGPLSRVLECYQNFVVEVLPPGSTQADASSREGGEGGQKRTVLQGGVLQMLKEEMCSFRLSGDSSADTSVVEVCFIGDEDNSNNTFLDCKTSSHNVLPFDFMGGYVGFLGYDVRDEAGKILDRHGVGTEWNWKPQGRQAETGKVKGEEKFKDSSDVPLAFFIFADRFLAFDHQEGKAYALALVEANRDSKTVKDGGLLTDKEGDNPAVRWVLDTAETIQQLANVGNKEGSAHSNISTEGKTFVDDVSLTAPPVVGTNMGEDNAVCFTEVYRSEYEESLKEIMRLVGDGETYEVCLTNQIICKHQEGGHVPPLELYARLRKSNPAPYAAFLYHDPYGRLRSDPESRMQDGEVGLEDHSRRSEGVQGPAFAVCCSSPERFLKVDCNGWVESKPIKGTVKRGATPAEDIKLAVELADSEKNMAENLMIVDLVRNDLGRVCQMGSVSVPKLMQVESYATVHQLVSTVQGQLRPGCGVLDAIAAAFPGGSMTGAPKRRTMDIIERLEGFRSRGVYSGSIGFLSVNGAADLNIVIRTAVVTPSNITVGAGGAVVALSNVEDEYSEMVLKARSVIGAIGAQEVVSADDFLGRDETSTTAAELPPATPAEAETGDTVWSSTDDAVPTQSWESNLDVNQECYEERAHAQPVAGSVKVALGARDVQGVEGSGLIERQFNTTCPQDGNWRGGG
ncbi:unnamed protein product [Choristocarpus tenellus]